MKSMAKKRLLSLVLVICMLVGILAILPISIPVSAAITTSNNYFFKVGSTSALANGARKTFTEAPFVNNGTVYVPTSALSAAGISASSSSSVTVDGKTVSAVSLSNMASATGYTAYISNMNVIGLSKNGDPFSGKTNDEQVELMKKFLFDAIGTDGNSQNSPFTYQSLQSTSHPYIMADQSTFDSLSQVWMDGRAGKEVDEVLYSYIDAKITSAERLYDQYAQQDANGNYLSMNTTVNLVRGEQEYIYQMPYKNNNGYDVGGRQSASGDNANRILQLAYAYQITKNINYAKLAYQYAIYLGEWEHWGPGHMLNAADASSPYALAYDWLYPAWKQLENENQTYKDYNVNGGFDTKVVTTKAIEDIIFTHSIIPAYYSIVIPTTLKSHDESLEETDIPWWSAGAKAGGWDYHTDTNNWNAVCSAGFTVAALALVGVETSTSGVKIDVTTTDQIYNPQTDFTTYLNISYGCNKTENKAPGYTTYREYCEYMVNANIHYLPLNGMGVYVPDGSYIESNGYWDYGTNNVFEMAAALTTATGTDYGLLDTWGIDKTCYYAINTMSSDGLSWNYHDSNSTGPIGTDWFMYLASDKGLGDKTLAGIRRDFNKNFAKQTPSYYDSLFYMTSEEIGEYEYPELSYYMEGTAGYVVRDSWDAEEGSLFGAFMGEGNGKITMNGETSNFGHGQIDSGAFVYYNKGTRWFCDLGTEEYNAYNFWSYASGRAGYYPMSAEGNNTLIVTSQGSNAWFTGQSYNGNGVMTKHGENEHGGYAIIDNTSVYYKQQSESSNGTQLASSAYRGMMLTNDRKTFVLQDQVSFKSAQSVAWIGHLLSSTEVMLSVDGTVAYLSDGTTVIKATIIDPDNLGLKWRHAYCTEDEFLLDYTVDYDYSESNNGVKQKDFSDYQKLLIEASGVKTFNLAVVIEEVVPGETMNDANGVGYTWTDMNNWNPTADGRVESSDAPSESGPAAGFKVTKIESGNDDNEGGTVNGEKPDTPIVDLWAMAGRKTIKRASARFDELELDTVIESGTAESFEELQSILTQYQGDYLIEIDLYRSNTTPLYIESPCDVTTNGNKLLAISNNYVANLDSGTLTYSKGTIQVTWVLSNGSRVTENYNGSKIASYKGSITTDSTIREKNNGDGTYSYYTTGNAWSTVMDGAQASENDMIVTSENCTFYQTTIPFDGLFVTVNGSTIKGYYSANDFFTAAVFSTRCDRISLTNDFGYDGTAKNDVRSFSYAPNLYLNGYTLTFTSADVSDHLFFVNGGDFHVYGPGGINSQAASSNMFTNDPSSGDNIYVENADLYSVRAIIDLRCSTATFKNCNITIEKDAPAFGAFNRNNVTPIAKQPYLYIDGCVINMPKITAEGSVITLQLNAKAEITGGTTIITTTDCYLFELINQPYNYSGTFDFDNGFTDMYAITGEVYHTLTKICKSTTDSSAGKTYDLSTRVFYGEGFTYTDATKPADFRVLDGLVSAKIDENTYVLTSASNCASVTWKNTSGTTVATEYWLSGTNPVASSTIKNKISVSSGNMLTFTTDTVSAGQSVGYTAIVIKQFGLKVNMSLQEDFNLNFFVENIGDMTFKIDGVPVTPDTVSLSGYYKVSKSGITPSSAAQTVVLEVTYAGTTLTKKISVIDYAEKILSGNNPDIDKRMMINVVKYAETAYIYDNKNTGSTAIGYSKVLTLYTKYKKYATVSVINRQKTDLSGITDAIYGAQLNLDNAPKFRFVLLESYTGDVTFTYTASNGEKVSKTFSVVNGTYGGNNYIEIGFKAYFMTDSITITTAKGTASYSLANYYYYEVNEHGALANLLNALYAYCETAKLYRDSVN